MKNFLRRKLPELLFFFLIFVFSTWLSWRTFSYKNGSLIIATKAFSDFASHVPFIRSFSMGNNFPPEFPLFPGESARYHFLFYLLVGFTEKLGLRIDYSLNLLSSLSFFLLCASIYFLAKEVFSSKGVGFLSVIFFLFNSSFSFLEFFKKNPLSTNTISEIMKLNTFPSFGPYDGKIVSAFWNLNIYTNQRHLALPLALFLFLLLTLFRFERKQKNLGLGQSLLGGIFLGLLPFAHSSIFFMAFVALPILFILLKKQRLSILIMLVFGGVLSLPRILFLKETAFFIPYIRLGYLIDPNNLTFRTFINYWFMNMGIFLLLVPAGFMLAKSAGKKLFASILPFFVVGNLIQFTPEIAANHKFFNVFIIIGNMFAAHLIAKLWTKSFLIKIIVVPIFVISILSGIIDFFPIINDGQIQVFDLPKNNAASWISLNTPKESVFLNSSYLYHPASLAGRKIFLGWPYFAWSVGYDTYQRDEIHRKMLNPTDIKEFCDLSGDYKIDYIILDGFPKNSDFEINFNFFENNFPLLFEKERVKIYLVNSICR